MIVQVEESVPKVQDTATIEVDEDFIKMTAFTAELESSIHRAESASGAILGDNRFVISTGKHKWMIYIRRIDGTRSEVVTEILE